MLRYIGFVTFSLIFNLTFAQETQMPDSIFTDTTHYNTYLNSVEGVSFNYPFDWDTTRIGPQYIFTVLERQTGEKDEFRENLLFGKVEISANLDFLLNSAIKSLKANNEKLVIMKEDIQSNAHNVEYAILKYSSNIGDSQVLTTNIYFRKGKYAYYIVLGCDSGEVKKFDQVLNKIISSIKLSN